MPWRPGARELLDELHTAGIRCALVTMSEAPLAREIVASLPKPYFDFLVTGDTVTQGKPHPEAYLTAVELLQEQDPELGLHHCIALEDSAPGVAAAVASGVPTVAIPHIVPLPHDPRHAMWDTLAGRTVADLEELVALRHEFPDATFGLARGAGRSPSMTDTDTRGRSGQDPQKQSRREGIPLGRIAGIPVILAYSWFIIAAFTVIVFGPVLQSDNPRPRRQRLLRGVRLRRCCC